MEGQEEKIENVEIDWEEVKKSKRKKEEKKKWISLLKLIVRTNK